MSNIERDPNATHYIQVGEHKVAFDPTVKITIYRNGYIMIGGDDIFDFGFDVPEIDQYGINIVCGETIIILGKGTTDATND